MPEQPFDADNPPPRIGRYEVLAPLGGGGMATVYLARGDNGRQVAVKLIRPNLAADEGFRQRFEREAAYARRVRQRYIAPVLDFGYHQGRPFLVTEYIEGPTLEQAVDERRSMPAHEVEQLAEQVASALVAIHAVNLVHRDLKPSNVILGRTGPRVIDFGIARALDDSGGLTSQNVRLGTPAYMAPEQFDDDVEVGKPADVFAWGGLLVFASTGRPPFGTASNLKEVDVLAHRIATKDPRLDRFEEPLRTLVRAAMAKNPDRRPTARDLVRRLSTGDQPTPAGAAPTTAEPAPTEPGPVPGFTAPVRPRPPVPPPTAPFWMDGGWQPAGVPADSTGRALPAWRALRVRAAVAVGAILLLLLGWLLMPPAFRLLLMIGVGGLVVLGLVGWSVLRSPSYRLELLLWPLGGLALLVAFLLFTVDQLNGQIWVTFFNDRVAVLQGAGPDGHMGTQNIHHVEQSPSAAHRGQVPALLAAALAQGIGVGSQGEGEQIARCLPWIFTPTIDTPPHLVDPCRTSAFATTPRMPVLEHHTVDTTNYTPAVAATDDQVLLAWTDSSDGSLQVSSSDDGLHFTSPEPLGDGFESDQEPALATDGSQFFLAWRDQLSGNLAVASSPDGRDFGKPIVLSEPTETAPALGYGHDTLLLAWVGDGSQLHLWPAADADSLQFLPEQQRRQLGETRHETSPAAPNLQYADEKWFLVWAGTEPLVNIRTYDGDLRDLTKNTLRHTGAPTIRHQPAVAVLDVWLLAWTRPDRRVGLLVSRSRQPGYANELALEVRSGAGVNLTTFQGHALLTWAGDEQQPGGHILRLP